LNLDLALPFTNSFQIGDDVSEVLGIVKWEKPVNAQLAGICKGNFPSLIPKTDQERVQNLKAELQAAIDSAMRFEVTEKLEGSSMTCYLIDGEFGVCSRNINLKETEGNSFWVTARKDNVEAKMREVFIDNYAVQGELIGEGIQGNIYGLKGTHFRVFDIYSIKDGVYLKPQARQEAVKQMGLNHAQVLNPNFKLDEGDTIDGLLIAAEGKSALADVEREGIVFKQVDGGLTFKAISNKYLLKQKD
jgi:RNA ligase (TIGR02306 family)